MSEQEKQKETWQQDSYETGYTRPQKSRGGVVAVLLVLVILLGGMASYLGLMNIRLRLKEEASSPIQFYPPSTESVLSEDGNELLPGVEGRTVSGPERAFYRWPSGVVVTKVQPGSQAAAAGLSLGDIITEVAGKPITDVDTLRELLKDARPGDQISVTFCRDGAQYYTFTCNWENMGGNHDGTV